MTIFFDIETIPSGEKLDAKSFNPPANYSKPETIANWYQFKAPEMVETEFRLRAVIPHKCTVICLAYAIDKEKPFCLFGEEADIFKEFAEVINDNIGSKQESVEWCGFNIKEFDLPIVRQRAFKYNLPMLKLSFLHSKYDNRIFDIMERFVFPSRNMVSMEEVAKFFGLKSKSLMTGAQVYDFYLDGKLEEIYQYCMEDVTTEREIYWRME